MYCEKRAMNRIVLQSLQNLNLAVIQMVADTDSIQLLWLLPRPAG